MSCAQIERDCPETGYLSFYNLSVDMTVEGLEITKASVPSDYIPEADDFTYVITGVSDGQTYYDNKGLPTGPIELPVGQYRIDVVYGANEFNQAYYTASMDNVLIAGGQTNTVDFDNVPLANAMVAVTLPDMTGHMEVSSISLSDGISSISIESGEYYFVPAGRQITASFSGVNSLGESKSVSLNVGSVEAQHAYDVRCNLELPSFTFADQASGAIAGRLYLTSLASLGGGLDVSKVVYEISSDSGQSWKTVIPRAMDGYWIVNQTSDGTSLAYDGTEYRIRAVYGGMVTDSWTFIPSVPSNTISGISIEHTYENRNYTGITDPLSVLTGTDVTVDGANMSYNGITASLISTKGSRGVELVNASGNVVRTITGNETGSMSVTDNWIYLPQGNYTLMSYFKIGDDKVYLSTLSGTSPAPTFKVCAYAETSYSRYQNHKKNISGYTLELANTAGTAEKIMGISGIVSISDEVLSKNAGLISGVTLKCGDSSLLSSGTTVTSSMWYPNTVASKDSDGNWELTGQSWGNHTLSASFTFDGVSSNGSTTCRITGLPYAIRTENATPTGWTTSNTQKIDVAGDYMCMKNSDAYAISPKFSVDKDFNILVTANAYAYKGTSGTYSPVIYFSASSTAQKSGVSKSVNVQSGYPITATFYDYSATLTFTSNVCQACLYAYGVRKKDFWGIDGFTPSVIVKNISIVYAD